MRELNSFVSGLYEAFILRDLMSYVLPGAIVLLSVLLLWRDAVQIKGFFLDLDWWLLVPLLGLTFIIGFALHCLGELVGLIKVSLIGDDLKCKERFEIFRCRAAEPTKQWLSEAYQMWATYFHATEETIWGGPHLERLVATKLMCGNVFMAMCLATVIVPVGVLGDIGSWTSYLFTISYALLFMGSLFWGHRVYMIRQDRWMETVKEQEPEWRKQRSREQRKQEQVQT